MKHDCNKPTVSEMQNSDPGTEFALERYRYILAQIGAVNEAAHKTLALYQALITTVLTAAVALFVGYERVGIEASLARAGLHWLIVMATLVGCFATIMLISGIASWWDYRHEEVTLTDEHVRAGFRRPPSLKNIFRWYETYVLVFIFLSTGSLWWAYIRVLLPAID